ncbi:MAG: hypothetical protein P1U63_06085 [Coxiellaceae bacterium]|nr:hypothetical protein [Coxiellaceae bacterium]
MRRQESDKENFLQYNCKQAVLLACSMMHITRWLAHDEGIQAQLTSHSAVFAFGLWASITNEISTRHLTGIMQPSTLRHLRKVGADVIKIVTGLNLLMTGYSYSNYKADAFQSVGAALFNGIALCSVMAVAYLVIPTPQQPRRPARAINLQPGFKSRDRCRATTYDSHNLSRTM